MTACRDRNESPVLSFQYRLPVNDGSAFIQGGKKIFPLRRIRIIIRGRPAGHLVYTRAPKEIGTGRADHHESPLLVRAVIDILDIFEDGPVFFLGRGECFLVGCKGIVLPLQFFLGGSELFICCSKFKLGLLSFGNIVDDAKDHPLFRVIRCGRVDVPESTIGRPPYPEVQIVGLATFYETVQSIVQCLPVLGRGIFWIARIGFSMPSTP